MNKIWLEQYPVAVAAILRARSVPVNLNPPYTPREREHRLKDSGASRATMRWRLAAGLAAVRLPARVAGGTGADRPVHRRGERHPCNRARHPDRR